MAESWGGGSPTRCYFVYSTSATDATYSISISGYIYLPSSHSSSGGFPRYWSGWWGSGSRTDVFNLNMNGAGTTSLIASGGYNIGRAFGANGNAAFAISGSTYWGSADHSINFTIPARPYIIPRPPISPSVARISDNQATVSWTRDADASNQAQPWSGVYVERWSQSTGTWTRIATVTAADATSYSDAGIVSNNRYKYRVISYNATGSSAPAETSHIATTPTAPTAVSAEKQNDLSIVVTWTNTANYQSGSKILDNGSEVGTVGAGVSTWTHTTPNPAVPHIYRIVAVADDRESAESTPSNTVQLQAPPNAPTNVTSGIPTYSVIDENPGGVQPALLWKHNPVDSSVQRKYQIRMRKTGESVWESLAENTTSRESSDLAEITTALDINWGYAAGQYELQVRTWGADANPGPYSATASFRLEHNPTVALISPESAEVIDRSRIMAEWSYSQAETRPQQQFTLTLRQSGDVVWERTANGTALSYEIPYTLLDDVEYSLSLEVIASNGLSSGTQTVVFSVDYAEPALPGLIVEFSEGSGANNLSINNPSLPIETLLNRVYRCIDPRSWWMGMESGSREEEYENLFTNPRFVTPGQTVEVRRNLARRPSVGPSGTAGWIANGVAAISNSGDRPRGDRARAIKCEIPSGWSSTPGVMQARSSTEGPVSSGVAGTAERLGLWVWAKAGQKLLFRVFQAVADGSLGSERLSFQFTGTGAWQWVEGATSGKNTANQLLVILISVAVAENPGVPAITFYVMDALNQPNTMPGGYFDASTRPVEETPEMGLTVGAHGSGGSVLEGIQPAGITPANCFAIQADEFAQEGGKSLRLIPNASVSDSSVILTGAWPAELTALATVHLKAPQTGGLFNRARGVYATAPDNFTQAANLPGSHEVRLHQIGAGLQGVHLYNGASLGNGDVYWTLPAIMAGKYDDDSFSGGSSGAISDGGMRIGYRWTGVSDSSTSIKRVTFPEIVDSEWELVGEFAPNTTISDYEGVTYGRTVYRVEAVSEIPSSKTNAISIDVWSTRVWLGAGDGYSTVASIPYDIEISDKDELAFQQEHYFDGIDLPTLVTGKAIDHEISVSGTLDPLREEGSTIDELRRVIRTPGNKVFRDHDGRRLYVSVSGGLKHDRRSRKIRGVNVEMKEVTK